MSNQYAGTIENKKEGIFINNGRITQIGFGIINNISTINNNKKIINESGEINNNKDGIINNKNLITNEEFGTINNNGEIYNTPNGKINPFGTIVGNPPGKNCEEP